jgi:oxysterol-binding protein-related protein 9/10/11
LCADKQNQLISTIRGDLSSITAPPFLLATQSTTQYPQYWAENPIIFVAPTQETIPEKRALLVLRWFLSTLKRQQYGGRQPNQGIKKPLNAILGELFIAEWRQDGVSGVTKLVSEQVRQDYTIQSSKYIQNSDVFL